MMERLTERHYKVSDGAYLKCSEECTALCCDDCDKLDNIVDRLAAYEDTGLTPEEVLRQNEKILCMDFHQEIKTDRLVEIVRAEREGRLLVLPCKVGDTVWEIVRRQVDISGYRMEWKWVTTIAAVKFRIWMTDAVGKTIFLTREEAEKKSKEKIPE